MTYVEVVFSASACEKYKFQKEATTQAGAITRRQPKKKWQIPRFVRRARLSVPFAFLETRAFRIAMPCSPALRREKAGFATFQLEQIARVLFDACSRLGPVWRGHRTGFLRFRAAMESSFSRKIRWTAVIPDRRCVCCPVCSPLSRLLASSSETLRCPAGRWPGLLNRCQRWEQRSPQPMAIVHR